MMGLKRQQLIQLPTSTRISQALLWCAFRTCIYAMSSCEGESCATKSCVVLAPKHQSSSELHSWRIDPSSLLGGHYKERVRKVNNWTLHQPFHSKENSLVVKHANFINQHVAFSSSCMRDTFLDDVWCKLMLRERQNFTQNGFNEGRLVFWLSMLCKDWIKTFGIRIKDRD